ncbi:hypothetical protein CDD83_5429 [Cordyceps sp. RAO-2017]|nr:hypothetical protein CDD83_5429 [Cordyceps sp. RAO-2017]
MCAPAIGRRLATSGAGPGRGADLAMSSAVARLRPSAIPLPGPSWPELSLLHRCAARHSLEIGIGISFFFLFGFECSELLAFQAGASCQLPPLAAWPGLPFSSRLTTLHTRHRLVVFIALLVLVFFVLSPRKREAVQPLPPAFLSRSPRIDPSSSLAMAAKAKSNAGAGADAPLSSAQASARTRRDTYHEADVVVVGAGIFGCAIAFALANQGRSVLLLERWMKEPDRIVGELLQPGGVAALKKLGLGHCLDGIDAIPCLGYNVLYHGQESLVPYPAVDDDGQVRSPC